MKRYALVVGMSVYESPHLESLPKTVHSAEAIAQVLEQYGDFQEVRRLPANWLSDERAEVAAAAVTEVDLVKEIKYVLQQADLGELLIYFSGHGFVVADSFGDSKAYLAASNTQIDLTADQVIGQRQGISLESLSKELFHANLSSLVLLLDCCHAGAVITQASVQASFAKAGDRDYTILAACRAFEKAYAGDENSPYSIFTDALIRGLAQSQANDRGVVSSDRLADAVNERLKGQELLRMSRGRLITLVHYLAAPPKSEPLTEPFQAENPYRGLYSFEERHAGQFFGRESVIWDVVRRVEENRFLAVIGASGCGKSSLVKAGVMPKLRQNSVLGSAQWQIDIFKPGRTPHQKLMACLEKLADDRPILLIIDQFEEVFTLCEDEQEKDQFMRLINYQVNQKTPEMRVVVTIRGDFLDRCANYEIAGLINKSRPTGYVVRPLEREELMAAIAQPAAAYGVTFETGLVNQIASDVLDRPGALPMLQYALRELWKVCVQDNGEQQLTWAGYRRIGGVIRALEKRANLLFGSFSASEQALVQRIFTEELVQLNDDESVTRRRTTWERLAAMGNLEQVRSLVDQLADQRLVVTDETTVEVAHEALLSQWGLLRDWLEHDREKIQLRRHLESSYNDWRIRYTRSDDALLMGALLGSIEEKLDWHNLPEAEYVQYSLARRDQVAQQQLEQERELRELAEVKAQAETQLRELAEVRVTEEAAKAELAEKRAVAEQNQAKSERRLKWFAITSTGVVSLLAAIAGFLWRNAEYQEVDALVKSAQAQFVSNRSSLDTLLAAVKADDQRRRSIWAGGDPRLQVDALQVLQQANYWVRERDRLGGENIHGNFVQSVGVSPHGDLIATASFDKTVKLWDLQGHLKQILPHGGEVMHVSFHPTEDVIFTASKDHKVQLWKSDGRLKQTISLPQNTFAWSISFDPKSQTIAAACSDGAVRFWKLHDNPQETFFGNDQKPWKPYGNQNIYSVSFSPDSRMIAVASEDGNAKLRFLSPEVKGKELILKGDKTIPGHAKDKRIYRVRFSPDSRIVATASDDNLVILWNSQTSKLITYLKGHESGIHDVAFHRKFKKGEKLAVSTIATASLDGTIKLWNSEGELMETLIGHSSRVNSVDFSPNGTFLVSGSNDRLPRLWQVNNLELTVLPGHQGKVYKAAISSDKSRVITESGDDSKIMFWKDGQLIKEKESGIFDVARFSGQETIAIAGNDNIRLLDWQGRQKGIPLPISDVVFMSLSPRNEVAVINNSDQQAKIWNFQTQRKRILPEQGVDVVRFSPDGELIATASFNGQIKIWNLEGQPIKKLESDLKTILDLRFTSSNQELVAASENGKIVRWNLESNQVQSFEQKEAVTTINFNSKHDLVTASDDGTAMLWNKHGQLMTSFVGHKAPVNSAVFNEDGQILVTASSDNKVILWHGVDRLDLEHQRNRACAWLKDYLLLQKDEASLCN
jgi:WD40 repeat protein/energy-coupling factor transporter ATP-binding protein EcfA2